MHNRLLTISGCKVIVQLSTYRKRLRILKKFNARRKFKGAVHVVIGVDRFQSKFKKAAEQSGASHNSARLASHIENLQRAIVNELLQATDYDVSAQLHEEALQRVIDRFRFQVRAICNQCPEAIRETG